MPSERCVTEKQATLRPRIAAKSIHVMFSRNLVPLVFELNGGLLITFCQQGWRALLRLQSGSAL
jgi:hypothetical protein